MSCLTTHEEEKFICEQNKTRKDLEKKEEGPMLRQFMKNSSLWEVLMLEKFVEDCLLW